MYSDYGSFIILMLYALVLFLIIGIVFFIYRRPPGILKKFYKISVKKRNRIKTCIFGLGCMIVIVLFIFSIQMESMASIAHVSGKKEDLSKKENLLKVLNEKQQKKVNKGYVKTIKKIEDILEHYKDEVLLYDEEDVHDSDGGSSWSGENGWITLNAEIIVTEDSDVSNDGQELYQLIHTGSGDYEEHYSQLPEKKKSIIQKMEWREKKGILYAVNEKGVYIDGTAQLNLKNSQLVKEFENAGFKGIQKWIQTCENSKDGILVQINKKKTRVFHDTASYHRFTSHGITFLYNYREFIIETNAAKVSGIKNLADLLPEEGRGQWQILKVYPGGKYQQIVLETRSDDHHCSKIVRICIQKDKIRQITIGAEVDSGIILGENEKEIKRKQEGFYEKEKIFLKECFLKMGIDEKEATQWLNHFQFTQTKKNGKIGSYQYQCTKNQNSMYEWAVIIN